MHPPPAAQYPLTYTQESVEGQACEAVVVGGRTYRTGSRCSEPSLTHLPSSTYLHTPNRQSMGAGGGRDHFNLPGVGVPDSMSACRAR